MRNPPDGDVGTGIEPKEDDESFLARWSRRKQAGHLDTQDPPAAERQSVSGEQPPANEQRRATAQQPLTDADMPPVESLDETSDYAPFMSPGVSQQLRTQALRRLFHLPGLHVPDGLDDYDEDFTQFAKLGNIVTHEMERMLKRERHTEDAKDATSQAGRVKSDKESEVVHQDAQRGVDGGDEDVPREKGADTEEQPSNLAVSPDSEPAGPDGSSG